MLFPSLTNCCSSCSFGIITSFSVIIFLFPIKYLSSFFIIASTPKPAIALNSFKSSNSIFSSIALLTIALAIGCSDFFSILAIFFKSSFSSKLL